MKRKYIIPRIATLIIIMTLVNLVFLFDNMGMLDVINIIALIAVIAFTTLGFKFSKKMSDKMFSYDNNLKRAGFILLEILIITILSFLAIVSIVILNFGNLRIFVMLLCLAILLVTIYVCCFIQQLMISIYDYILDRKNLL